MSARSESSSNSSSRVASGMGFVSNKPLDQEDLPAAMDAEVYVDGKLEVKTKKKNKKDQGSLADKKRKEMKQKRDFSEICGFFRGN